MRGQKGYLLHQFFSLPVLATNCAAPEGLEVRLLAVLAVVALVGAGMWVGPLNIEEEVMPIAGGKAEVPHYILNMWENWKLKFGRTYDFYEEE